MEETKTKTKKEPAPDFALLREGSRYALADLRDPMGAVEFADEEESLGAPEETIVLPCGARLAVYAGNVGGAETCGYRQALEACDRAYRERAPLDGPGSAATQAAGAMPGRAEMVDRLESWFNESFRFQKAVYGWRFARDEAMALPEAELEAMYRKAFGESAGNR